MLRRAFDWLFRDRTTGRIVVMQWPNVPLATFLVATVVRVVTHPHGTAGKVLSAVGTAALVVWAGEEVWTDDGDRLDVDAHAERLTMLLRTGGVAHLRVSGEQLPRMLDAAGPITAWA